VNSFFRYIIVICFFSISSNLLGQGKVVLRNGEEYFGRVKAKMCFGRGCDSLKIVVSDHWKSQTFSGYEIEYFVTKRGKSIVRKYKALNDAYQSYFLEVEGTIKVFDCKLSDEKHIFCLELGNGMFFPVTEKIYYKWILPYMLEKDTFRDWYEKNNENFVYPSAKKDRLGGKNQKQVNKFIIKISTIYNLL
jgi:predicted AlkP superfamily pyrophosphatase or phosphodiesterase